MKKTITFGIPCYNSAAYMDKCVESILEGSDYADDVQIVIVDDGSAKDDTSAKADEWQRRYPNIVKAVHQENGGHGVAVMKAVANADGVYFTNIDSDDWADADALRARLAKLREFIAADEQVDLVLTNYVYEHVEDNTRNAVNYRRQLPVGRVFGWNEIGHFKMWKYLLMHALTYRTETLRRANLQMPPHTFYVDNIYAYVPFPLCHSLYYLDVDLYRYFIGRQDQSVNEKVMVSRYRQQLRISKIMFEALHLYDEVESQPLRAYMLNYLTMMMAISSLFGHMSDEPESDQLVDELWRDLKAFDERMYNHARHNFLGVGTNLPGKVGKRLTAALYRTARKIFKFN